jgi:hypothetical protein
MARGTACPGWNVSPSNFRGGDLESTSKLPSNYLPTTAKPLGYKGFRAVAGAGGTGGYAQLITELMEVNIGNHDRDGIFPHR